MQLVPLADAAAWDAAVARFPHATAFHDRSWLSFAADTLDLRFVPLAVRSGGELVGVAPMLLAPRWTPDLPAVPFPYVGPLVAADLLVPTLRALRSRQRRTGVLLAHFDLDPHSSSDTVAQRLRTAGVEVRADSTVVLDLSHGSVDRLRAGLSRNRRRNLRRAHESGVTVRRARAGELAAVLPAVLDDSYGAHATVNPYPADIGERVQRLAGDTPAVTSWVALLGHEPVGALVMLGGHPTAIAWAGGCLRRHRHLGANVLLHQTAIEAAMAAGHRSIDFSGWVDDAVGAFKLGFGGRRRTYLRLESWAVPQTMRRAVRAAAARTRG